LYVVDISDITQRSILKILPDWCLWILVQMSCHWISPLLDTSNFIINNPDMTVIQINEVGILLCNSVLCRKYCMGMGHVFQKFEQRKCLKCIGIHKIYTLKCLIHYLHKGHWLWQITKTVTLPITVSVWNRKHKQSDTL
jgi:hypothetical protein